ncbi:MAG: PTS cellobiose transporter subunit IIC [Fusobacteria bacterium]|nr:PTS cellobiose transporter subunit IIC [Fusobacteriota bacterium]
MNKFSLILEKKLMPIAFKIGSQRHLQAIRDGIVLITPFVIIGSIFLIIANLPIAGYPALMAHIFGPTWQDGLQIAVNATFGLAGILACIGIAYRLAGQYKIDSLACLAISLCVYIMLIPIQLMPSATGVAASLVLPIGYLNSSGIFVGIIVAFIVTEIFRIFVKKNIMIKMPEGVPPAVMKTFAALIPGLFIIFVFWFIRIILAHTGFHDAFNIVAVIIGKPVSILGGSLIGVIVAVTIAQILWLGGIQGQALIFGIMAPIWLNFTDQNRLAYIAGQHLPNVITQPFLDLFYSIGGSGVTFSLVFLMLFRARSKQLKSIARLAAAPALFNINEPVIFGLPIILNPIMVIPFVVTPIVVITMTYFAMKLGLVAHTVGIMLPWTTPPIISGYLATGGHISGAVMQIVTIFVAGAIYYPFFKIFDRQKLAEENSIEKESV